MQKEQKDPLQSRQVKTAFLETGITVAHQATTSLNDKRHGIDIWTTPTGLHVTHIKTGSEYLVPYSNVLMCEYKEDTPPL